MSDHYDDHLSPVLVEPERKREGMNTSNEIGSLVDALAKAQAVIEPPKKDREVTVKTKQGYSYKFKYATLDAIIAAVRKPLTDNGLWFTQSVMKLEGQWTVETRLLHKSGQFLSSSSPLLIDGADNKNQAFGSALTYMKRYTLAALLGLSVDEDDDGNAADGNEAVQTKGPEVKKAAPSTKATAKAKTAAKGNGDDAGKPEVDQAALKKAQDWAKAFIAETIQPATDLDALNASWDSNQSALTSLQERFSTEYDEVFKRYTAQKRILSQAAG